MARKYCKTCTAVTKFYVVEEIENQKTLVCIECNNPFIKGDRECLKCDITFSPKSKNNRICSNCTAENEGVVLYEYHR
jgi:hypothetical protein